MFWRRRNFMKLFGAGAVIAPLVGGVSSLKAETITKLPDNPFDQGIPLRDSQGVVWRLKVTTDGQLMVERELE
jgi:hypothetical protein